MAGGIKDPGEAPDLQDVLDIIKSAGGSTLSSNGDANAKAKAEEEKRKRFIKSYPNLIISIYGTKGVSEWQKKAMAQAAKSELAASTFLTILRRYDPRYVRTDDYKTRAAAANEAWKQYFPNAKHAPQGLINGYARSDKDPTWLAQRLRQTKAYQKTYQWMDVAKLAGSQAGDDPGVYRAYRDALNASYRNYLGREATPLEQKMMFHSGMTDNEFTTALSNVFGGVGNFRWVQGYVPETTKLQEAAFGAKTGNELYNAIGEAKQRQQTYMASRFKPFDLGLEEETGDIVMNRI